MSCKVEDCRFIQSMHEEVVPELIINSDVIVEHAQENTAIHHKLSE